MASTIKKEEEEEEEQRQIEDNNPIIVDMSIKPSNVFDLHTKYKVEIDTMLELLKMGKDIDACNEADVSMLVDVFVMKLREGLLNCNEVIQKMIKKYDVDVDNL